GDIPLRVDDWAEAFDAVEPDTPHNDAREQVWETIGEILADRSGAPASAVAVALRHDEEFGQAFERAWPLLDPVALVPGLWRSPSFLRRCAPWLTDEEAAALQRDEADAWTVADLPLLDAARRRVGDPGASIRRARREAALAAERDERARVVDHLIPADDSE